MALASLQLQLCYNIRGLVTDPWAQGAGENGCLGGLGEQSKIFSVVSHLLF